MDPFFETVKRDDRRSVKTAAGPCDLPILYMDASVLGVAWRVDAQRATDVIRDRDAFEPWLAFGKAVAVMCAFAYRHTSIGPYGELGVGLLVRRKNTRPSWLRLLRDQRREANAALYVCSLPVTSEAARAAGVDVWGYPKYVTTMDTCFDDRGVRVVLGNELELSMNRGRGPVLAGLPFVTLSVKEERVIRTVIEVDHRVRWGGARSARVRLKGKGPTADVVRALGLHEKEKAWFAFRGDEMRSILPAGVDMGASR